ncbi:MULTISPECIES: Do family serine endopeptidase AlgW [Pseudomonas]|jgi:serine protease DegS|uniref:2-alkenal reductase n=1 Tax=Pseudomonas weihenstephanensis TaxID=1608994 RepID=A0A0J6IRJ8_9PSED|nr:MULTISPECIES: Do family serine endopeptidase AlgW [Pseudomonas]GLX88691.1 2-alkenal reductase [Pseudomonas fragi]KMN14632.1 2-alkenal reductase [Pseudomonas weihenstephanensis]KMN19811.1 2-alkenal reductase [Pseudomonas weihenstephanensis]KVV11800.1 putative periplasmic serine endoprotease DegP-like precursor [Pseudomonas sp. TAD18]KVV12091.1 putative periplasmic serine endoprotease DegP-like precursor [Pseudomonas sp. TAA207]
MLKALRFFGWPLLAGVLIALLIIQRYPQWVGLPSLDVNLQQAPQTNYVQQGPVTYADAVVRAAPAVANLYTTKVVNRNARPLFEDPQFRHFFGNNAPKQKRMESSLGSAVLMSPEGYLLTNNHVVLNADQIVVALKDGRETLARVIGSDPETDLAVLKIDLKNLPAITIGRSDTLRIGDIALAIGNPFGVGQTTTMGIISATGRNQLGLNNYEDFIQTDAAINPGNSGGALVDANGNLTGINTAIFTKSGGSQGIGFAIPINLAMEVMKSIIEHGQVIRGWLGIEVQPLTPDLAESFGLSGRPGIVVAGIFRDGPAQKAGLQLGDVILSIDGAPASDGRRSMNQVARIKPSDKISIQVMRNGKELKLTAEVGLRPPQEQPPQQE